MIQKAKTKKSKLIIYKYDGDNLEIIFPSKILKDVILFLNYKIVSDLKLRSAGGSDNQIDFKWIDKNQIPEIKSYINKFFGRYIKDVIKYNTLHVI